MAGTAPQSPYLPGYTGVSSQGALKAPSNKVYRPDAGQNLTDEEYTNWKVQSGQSSQEFTGNLQESLAEKQMQAESDLQSQAETRRMGALQGLMGGLQGGGGPLAEVSYNGSGIQGAEDSANSNAFARAKDMAGQTGAAALRSLHDVMGARGMNGSPHAAGPESQVINQGANQLGGVINTQLQSQLQANRQKASELYQGGITQRGQNIQATSPLVGLIGAKY